MGMRGTILSTLIILLLGATAQAGEWTRVDSETLVFKGVIDRGEFKKFKQVFDNKVKRLIVNSTGGRVQGDAVQIGRVIKEKGLDVYVDQQCYSACANYIFPAGKNKYLQSEIEVATQMKSYSGSVCYHGGGSLRKTQLTQENGELRLVAAEKLFKMLRDIYTAERALDLSTALAHFSKETGYEMRTIEDFDRYVESTLSQLRQADRFMKELGLHPRLMTLDAEMDRDWMCPSSSGLNTMGIQNVVGESKVIRDHLNPTDGSVYLFTGEFPEENSSCREDLKSFRAEKRCSDAESKPLECLQRHQSLLSVSCRQVIDPKDSAYSLPVPPKRESTVTW